MKIYTLGVEEGILGDVREFEVEKLEGVLEGLWQIFPIFINNFEDSLRDFFVKFDKKV